MLKFHRLMCRDHNLQENMLQALNTWWFMLGTQLLLFFTLSLRIFAQYVWSISGRVQNQASEVHMHDLKRNEFWRPGENIHRFCCFTWQRGTWCPGPVVGGVPGRTGNHFQQITHLWIFLWLIWQSTKIITKRWTLSTPLLVQALENREGSCLCICQQ